MCDKKNNLNLSIINYFKFHTFKFLLTIHFSITKDKLHEFTVSI